jgi:hypothetical protein
MKCPNYKRGCTTHGEVNPAKLLGSMKSGKQSEAQKKASRINGAKGGRPKKKKEE